MSGRLRPDGPIMTLIALDASGGPLAGAGDVLAVPVSPGDDGVNVGRGGEALAALGVDVAAVLASREAAGAPGEVIDVPVSRDGVMTALLVGVGDGSTAALRKAGAAMARRGGTAATIATTVVDGEDGEAVRALAEGAALAAYSFSRRSVPKPRRLERLTLVVDRPAGIADALSAAAATSTAVHLARDLAHTPSLEKTPAWMAEQAVRVAAEGGLTATVWDEQRLAAEGFGGIVAVGRGSSRPPRLVQLTYPGAVGTGTGDVTEHVVLIGKGITFDTGGLSLKPLDGMKAMKTDMAGAAAVLATMSALRSLGVRRRVTALLPLAENMPGAAATRPGDVIRHWGGRTVEVLNTDAEGRLVLADALAYAVARLAPDVVVDIATLTGAITLGLGRRHAGLYSTSVPLERALVDAGAAGGERLWPMPLVDAYRDSLDSQVADLRNVADPDKGYQGGSVIAALFLREFVRRPDGGNVPWAHLDIAGVGRADADEDEVTSGPTGFGVRTFLRYLTRSQPALGSTCS